MTAPPQLHPIDPRLHHGSAVYRLMIGLITPRPIAWIATRSAGGLDNLAPFSFFMGVGSAPPMVAVSINRAPGGGLKDTARNLLDRGDCTITLPQADDRQAVAGSAAAAPPDVSEFDLLGIERRPALLVAASMPATARLILEGRRHSHLDLGSTHLFVIEVVHFHVDTTLLRSIDPPLVAGAVAQPLARMGGADYGLIGAVISEPTPTFEALARARAGLEPA